MHIQAKYVPRWMLLGQGWVWYRYGLYVYAQKSVWRHWLTIGPKTFCWDSEAR